jgi:hypothetical protein
MVIVFSYQSIYAHPLSARNIQSFCSAIATRQKKHHEHHHRYTLRTFDHGNRAGSFQAGSGKNSEVFGFYPNLTAVFANNPAVLQGYLALDAVFEKGSNFYVFKTQQEKGGTFPSIKGGARLPISVTAILKVVHLKRERPSLRPVVRVLRPSVLLLNGSSSSGIVLHGL